MKCMMHEDAEAIGVCLACGRAVCTNCKLDLGGRLYCKGCVEAGRVIPVPRFPSPGAYWLPPSLSFARPLHPQEATLYRLGAAGAIIAGVAAALVGIGLTALLMHFSSFDTDPTGWLFVLYIACTLLLIGCGLKIAGFLGIFKAYRHPSAVVAAVFSTLAPVMLVVFVLVGIKISTSPYYWDAYYQTSYWSVSPDPLWMLTTIPIAGISFIMVYTSIIATRRLFTIPALATTTGILGTIAGALIAAVLPAIIGIGFYTLTAAEFLMASTLLRDARHAGACEPSIPL
ncbi:MAG: hypothetical protein AB1665_02480 [Candidatus Thermoplasmatota archaeon]